MTDLERGEWIAENLLWQPAEGSLFRFRGAVDSYTRFCEQAPLQPDELKLVLDYLRSDKEITDLKILGKSHGIEGKWVAKSAWLQTMPNEKFNGTESTRVRIYQTIVRAGSEGEEGDGPYVTENGCKYKIEQTFFWNCKDWQPVLPESTSGVSYSIQNLGRDKETGFYSYVLERRETVLQRIDEYEAEKTAFQERTEERILGLREGDEENKGREASVSEGKMVIREETKNADCTKDVSIRTVQEVEVPGASKTIRRTRRGTIVKTTDRNVAPEIEEGEEKDPEVAEGESVEREVTPGKLRNVTRTKFVSAAKDKPIEVSAEHGLTGTMHEDATEEILADGSEETAEPEGLQIEDVEVESYIPNEEEKDVPEGYEGSGDKVGGKTRRGTRTRIRFDDETGQRERRIVTQTPCPYLKKLSWKGERTARKVIIFRDQIKVPNVEKTFVVEGVTYSADDMSVSVNIGEFGLFSGVITLYKNLDRGGSGSSSDETSYNKEAKIEIKERYVRPGGRTYVRTYTVTKHVYHGSASGAAEGYVGGTEYPSLGLRGELATSGQRGSAKWYDNDLKLTKDEPES